eukprot:GGOE01013671.1.p1 GENE.GGOE01013671.1~~GGOE01013671.1.p1  ORF type:complete len:258 (-),score=91.13 GGOE01013671.1:176-859(-)
MYDPSAPVSMGTSIFACKFRDGVVMCADSRTSSGTYITNRTSNKLTQISDRIFCCRSGSAADTQAIADIVTHYVDQHTMEKGSPALTQTAARLFQQLCYHNRNSLLAGIIVGGWDPIHGGTVWSVPVGGSLVEQDWTVGGSGSTYIMGWLDANWKKDMTEEEALQYARTGIAHAMARDGSSGGVIRAIVITEAGVKNMTLLWDDVPYALEKDKNFAMKDPTADLMLK